MAFTLWQSDSPHLAHPLRPSGRVLARRASTKPSPHHTITLVLAPTPFGLGQCHQQAIALGCGSKQESDVTAG
ncbi:hypothetical protein HC928_10990 [bacterium]|nr:hypothetical protein [bacterium]